MPTTLDYDAMALKLLPKGCGPIPLQRLRPAVAALVRDAVQQAHAGEILAQLAVERQEAQKQATAERRALQQELRRKQEVADAQFAALTAERQHVQQQARVLEAALAAVAALRAAAKSYRAWQEDAEGPLTKAEIDRRWRALVEAIDALEPPPAA